MVKFYGTCCVQRRVPSKQAFSWGRLNSFLWVLPALSTSTHLTYLFNLVLSVIAFLFHNLVFLGLEVSIEKKCCAWPISNPVFVLQAWGEHYFVLIKLKKMLFIYERNLFYSEDMFPSFSCAHLILNAFQGFTILKASYRENPSVQWRLSPVYFCKSILTSNDSTFL